MISQAKRFLERKKEIEQAMSTMQKMSALRNLGPMGPLEETHSRDPNKLSFSRKKRPPPEVCLRSWSPIPGRRGSRTTCGDGAGSLDKEEVRHCLIQERLSKQDLGNLPQEEFIFAFCLTWGRKRRRIQREPQRFSGA